MDRSNGSTLGVVGDLTDDEKLSMDGRQVLGFKDGIEFPVIGVSKDEINRVTAAAAAAAADLGEDNSSLELNESEDLIRGGGTISRGREEGKTG